MAEERLNGYLRKNQLVDRFALINYYICEQPFAGIDF